MTLTAEKLAIHGGEPAVTIKDTDMFHWPIVTPEHEQAVLEVLHAGSMSGTNITELFEAEYAEATGMKHALACNNGTNAILCALFGMNIQTGDEVIVPSITYWASAMPVFNLGATPVFAEIDPENLCLDPNDIEHRITKRTKAIVVVHYTGMPADMDPILEIAKRHNLKVLEDCSHAHGTMYKGREAGTMGDASAFSLMSGKSLAIGEGGIMLTNNQRIYERGLLWGHYARHRKIESADLREFAGIPCGGMKCRMHQLSSAFGRVQLKRYPEQMAEIDRAMNHFADLLMDVPGVEVVRPKPGTSMTKGGWYAPLARLLPEEVDGVTEADLAGPLGAEGSHGGVHGANRPLHLHPVFQKMDIYGTGRPTRDTHLPAGETAVQSEGSLPISESIGQRLIAIPWFKHFRPEEIKQHADAYRKVFTNLDQLGKS